MLLSLTIKWINRSINVKKVKGGNKTEAYNCFLLLCVIWFCQFPLHSTSCHEETFGYHMGLQLFFFFLLYSKIINNAATSDIHLCDLYLNSFCFSETILAYIALFWKAPLLFRTIMRCCVPSESFLQLYKFKRRVPCVCRREVKTESNKLQ